MNAESRLAASISGLTGKATSTANWVKDDKNQGLQLEISSKQVKVGGVWKATYFACDGTNIGTGLKGYEITDKANLWCTAPVNYNVIGVTACMQPQIGSNWNDVSAMRLRVTGETDADGNPDWSKGELYDAESIPTNGSSNLAYIPFDFLGGRNLYFRLEFDTNAISAKDGWLQVLHIDIYDEPSPTPVIATEFNEDGTVSVFSDCGDLHLRYHVLDKDLNYLYTTYENPFAATGWNATRKCLIVEGGKDVYDATEW
ncbi:MAG: hypothetical protein K2M87_02435, partial [Muribaculaceae bacterium]|nr:hypothetical protein [Muribaculaceae bacterium]